MHNLFVTLRGIRHRRARSLIVVLLATIATAAAVVIPAYIRAAQQSVLTDTVTATRPATVGVTVGGRLGPTAPDLATVRASMDAALPGTTVAEFLDPPIGTVWWQGESLVAPARHRTTADVVFRAGVCDHLVLTAGSCPRQRGEVLVSARSVADTGWQVGQRIDILPPGLPGFRDTGARPTVPFTITGLYQLADEQAAYWGSTLYLDGGRLDENDNYTADTIFVGVESDLLAVPGTPEPRFAVEYHLRDAAGLRLDQVPVVRADLDKLSRDVTAGAVSSGLPASLDEAAEHQAVLVRSVPLIAVPLVLLCWFVLFLVVAALTEERGPEIALGKLRGLRLGQVAFFAVAEPMLLIALATPFGIALGLGLTEVGARAFLADGGHVELRAPVLLAAAAAFAGAGVAAALATRRTVRASVLSLLRRIPPRAPWRAVVVESAVGALALVGLLQVLAAGDRTSPLAYLAPPLLAVVAGLIAARLLTGWARLRGRTAAQRGDVSLLLATAQLGRRPATARVVVLMTVAVALLSFSVTIWDVGAINRMIAARVEVGAPVVHTVTAADPAALLAAVRAADPDGRRAMAVAWSSQRYADENLRIATVDAPRLGAVASWPGRDAAQTAAVGELLAPAGTDGSAPIPVRGPVVEADVEVGQLTQTEPMRLVLLVARGTEPQVVTLGPLRPGRHTYQGRIDGCADGCRLLGLSVRRYPTDSTESTVDLTVAALRDGGRPLDAGLTSDGAWRAPAEPPTGLRLTVRSGAGGLRLTGTSSSADLVAEYADDPVAAPAVVAGSPLSADGAAQEFSFLTFGDEITRMRVVDRSQALPGVGRPALMLDLSTVLRQAERDGLGDLRGWEYQVWTTADAGPELVAALADAGVRVTGTRFTEQRHEELGRLAPALALRLYLLAGVVAALLGIGVLLLNIRVGARARLRDMAALRLVGVSRPAVRRALRREYTVVVAVPLVVGLLAGLGGAALLLPAIPLAEVGADALEPVYRVGAVWIPSAVAALLVALLLAAASVLRTADRADPRLLREEAR
ncbi:FtsX-like permease family protein [Polymorphospora sp. NPDC050346]|uniref:FtsX-like permease family protein n=1 Tax=Polymorphospora sp. NPDC050346 TaxID=3155780 RepID=UPI0033CB833F